MPARTLATRIALPAGLFTLASVGALSWALIRSQRTNALEEAYKTLDCSPDMSDEEIKRVYRQKCIEYHPDKLASKGLPDEFMQYAQEQLAKINDAYSTIKQARA